MPSVPRRTPPGPFSSRVRACAALVVLAAVTAAAAPAAAQPSGPNVAPLPPVANKLPRATPESQGVSSQALLAFIEALDAGVDTMNSVIVVRHGQVIAEGWWAPFAADTPHQMFSVTKSFTSTAVGLAQAEGKLSIDDPVLKYFPDVTPAAGNDFQKGMRIRDLLAMSTGHRTEPSFQGSTTWTKTFFEHPVLHKPGTIFLYNTPARYILSAIVQKATDQGYGYQFWRSQGVMNLVWEKLLPALGAATLPDNLAATQALTDRLAAMMVKPISGTLRPASGAVVFGKPYKVPANDQGVEAIALVRGDGGASTLKLTVKGTERAIGLKQGEWQTGRMAWGNLTLTFTGDTVQIDREMNVGGGPKPAAVTGKIE